MDRDGEEPPAAKRPRLGGATNAAVDTKLEVIEEHIALSESNFRGQGR